MKILLPLIILFTTFVSRANECPEGTYQVSEHTRSAYDRGDGTHVSKSLVSTYCKNYRAAEKLSLKFPTKRPDRWPFKTEVFKKCTSSNRTLITKLFDSLPKVLTQVGKLEVFCARTSATQDNPATTAPEGKVVVLYESAFTSDLKRILIHELAHLLYFRFSKHEKNDYWQIADWKYSAISNTPKTERKKFSAPDGALDPEEDFANNVESFFSNQEAFNKNLTQISQWLLHFFKESQ